MNAPGISNRGVITITVQNISSGRADVRISLCGHGVWKIQALPPATPRRRRRGLEDMCKYLSRNNQQD